MQVLFICCDMGETNALLPVMQEMQVNKVDFKVLAMGAAISKLQSQAALKDRVIELQEKVDTIKERAKPLADVAAAVGKLEAVVVISGPASKAQEQITQAIPAKKKIVYLDNFNYATTNPAFETVRDVTKVAQKAICVTQVVKEQVLATQKGTLKAKDIKCLGRPSLESWVAQVQQVNRSEALQKTGFKDDRKVVTFIGGYGPRYDQGVFKAFDEASHELARAGFHVHVQHHPNAVKEQPLSTIEAVGVADWVVCYDSTVGFEALFANKNVVYLQPKTVEPYDNIAIEKKLAPRVHTSQELLEVLKTPIDAKPDVYQVLGVERKSTQAITQYILKKLQKSQ